MISFVTDFAVISSPGLFGGVSSGPSESDLSDALFPRLKNLLDFLAISDRFFVGPSSVFDADTVGPLDGVVATNSGGGQYFGREPDVIPTLLTKARTTS